MLQAAAPHAAGCSLSAAALTLIHSSSLTNRIKAKRKNLPSKVPSAHLRGSSEQPGDATSGPSRAVDKIPPSPGFFWHTPCDLVDGRLRAGRRWWAEQAEISSESFGGGRAFSTNGWKVLEVGAVGRAAVRVHLHGNRSVWCCYKTY